MKTNVFFCFLLLAFTDQTRSVQISYDSFLFQCSDFETTNTNVKLTRNELILNEIYLNYYHRVLYINSRRTAKHIDFIYSRYYCTSNRLVQNQLMSNETKKEKLEFLYKLLYSPISTKCLSKTLTESLAINITIVERKERSFKMKYELNLFSNNFNTQETFYESIKFQGCSTADYNYNFQLDKIALLNCSDLTDNVTFIKHNEYNDDVLDNDDKYEIVNNVLIIKKIENDHFKSTFQCISKHYKLNKRFERHPYINEVKTKSMRLFLGSKVNLKCDIVRPAQTSNHDAVLKWFKKTTNSTNIEHNTELFNLNKTDKIVNLDFVTFSLEIINLTANDVGVYFCVIKNDYGIHYREFEINYYDESLLFLIFGVTLIEIVIISAVIIIKC